MKKQFVWSFIGTFVVMIAALVLVLAACSKKDESSQQPVNTGNLKFYTEQQTCTPGAVYELWGGQTLDWGTVQVWTDEANLFIQYLVNQDIPNLSISQIHVWIGTIPGGFPKNGQGVPLPGQFPINIAFNPTVTEYLVTTPLEGLGLVCEAPFYIMAHAVMSDGITTQTAWGGAPGCMQTVKGNGTGRWYFEIGLCSVLYYGCECDGPPDVICTGYQFETAYGGNLAGPIPLKGQQAWWKYYLTSTGGVQTLWAGQTIDAGTVEYTSANNGTITITLGADWELNYIDENGYPDPDPVKWQGYYTLPTQRPIPGHMAHQTNTLILSPVNDLITGYPYTYYVIHVSVRKCVLWE
jgi:hypothetical protein